MWRWLASQALPRARLRKLALGLGLQNQAEIRWGPLFLAVAYKLLVCFVQLPKDV